MVVRRGIQNVRKFGRLIAMKLILNELHMKQELAARRFNIVTTAKSLTTGTW